ncbi:MAG: uroporphyrinogen-III synthase, partial [Deltaproteobacteria bacterium]|nr:uroporphyrinogen-III synthase [Deltaproteobacteria bacterium]
VVPVRFVAEELAAALLPRLAPGSRVLLARAQQAREVLPQTLEEHGVQVDVVPVYQARRPLTLPPEAMPFLEAGKVDLLTFTSSATVHHFVALVGQEKFQELAERAVVAAIGPVTAAALGEYGVKPQIQPQDYTIPALAAAIKKYFAEPLHHLAAPAPGGK